jgi:hypothetical protein
VAIGGKNGHKSGLSEPRNAQTLPVPYDYVDNNSTPTIFSNLLGKKGYLSISTS